MRETKSGSAGVIIIFICACISAMGQHIANTFRYPLDGKPELSGNYAEIRPNHFHAGLDLRTDNFKNLPIYAIDEGYVSRIKVSTSGYGKVLYITHPNGYVSVYAHQHHYSTRIGNYVKAAQSIGETFEIELFPKPDELPVKKGEVIGFTGNTGNSNGPHLHFEIREEKSEIPLNPLRFFEIPDTVEPEIKSVYFYDLNNMEDPARIKEFIPRLNGKNPNTKEVNSAFLAKEVIGVPSCFGIGIAAFDRENANTGLNQVYSIEIVLDNVPFYKHVLDSIAFDKARYVNCFTDLAPDVRSKKIQKCFLAKNEDLPVFKLAVNNGELMLNDTATHNLKIIVSDIKGNKKELLVRVKQKKASCKAHAQKEFDCLRTWDFQKAGYAVTIPDRTFFNDFDLFISTKQGTTPGLCSNILVITGSNLPLFKAINISLEPYASAAKLPEKLCLVELDSYSYCGGEQNNGKISGKTKNPGSFALVYDTMAPVIKPYPLLKKTKSINAFKTLSFKVSDNLSGIDKFRMEINGKWVLSEYEHKENTIYYTIDANTPVGRVDLVLTVYDKKGNKASFSSSYTH